MTQDITEQNRAESEQKQSSASAQRDVTSDYWRRNKSQVQAVELAELIRSLQRLCKELAPEDMAISWLTEKHKNEVGLYGQNKIMLTSKFIAEEGKYPASAKAVDATAGVCLHELGHHLIGSDNVRVSGLTKLLANICEDYIIENSPALNNTAKAYVKKSRAETTKMAQGLMKLTGNPLTDGLNGAVMLILNGYPVALTERDAQKIMLLTVECARTVLPWHKRADCFDRAERYMHYAEKIKRIVNAAASRQATEEALQKGRSKDDWETRYEKKNKAIKMQEEAQQDALDESVIDESLPEDLAESVSKALASEATDNTEFIQRLTGVHSSFPTITTREPNSGEFIPVDAKLLKELDWLRMLREDREVVTARAQESGRPDSQRMYRAAIDGRVFKNGRKKKQKPKQTWILMDNSGSMGSKVELFYIAATVHAALPDSRIYLYDDHNGINVVNRVDYRGKSVYPGGGLVRGGTPSGEALVYTSEMLQREGGGILIHFTDGEPTSSVHIGIAMDTIKTHHKDVTVIHVIWNAVGSHTYVYRDYNPVWIKTPEEFSSMIKKHILQTISGG